MENLCETCSVYPHCKGCLTGSEYKQKYEAVTTVLYTIGSVIVAIALLILYLI